MKLLVVDDEKLERELVKNAISMGKNDDIEIVGEASNGKEALELLGKMAPDVVITDINMPIMNGLTFSEELKIARPECHIIILTGYREFEHAKLAVRLGADDYIIKPIDVTELNMALKRVREKIDAASERNEYIQDLEKEKEENFLLLQESVIEKVISSDDMTEDFIEGIKAYNLDEIKKCVSAIIEIKEDNDEYSGVITNLKQWLKENSKSRFSIPYRINRIVVVFDCSDNMIKEIGNLRKYLYDNGISAFIIGVSSECSGKDCIKKAYLQSDRAVCLSGIFSSNEVIYYAEYQRINEKYNIDGYNWHELEDAFYSRVWSSVESAIDFFTLYIGKCLGEFDKDGLEYIKFMTNELLYRASGIIGGKKSGLFSVISDEEYHRKLNDIRDIEEMSVVIKIIIKRLLKSKDKTSLNNSPKLVDRALEYIDLHYMNSELSLGVLAEILYVNVSYLSRLFKQEIGDTFVEYLTKLRINKGIELLQTTDMKVYEVAEAVGIQDPHYFSICFKKIVGLSVREFKYKEQLSIDE